MTEKPEKGGSKGAAASDVSSVGNKSAVTAAGERQAGEEAAVTTEQGVPASAKPVEPPPQKHHKDESGRGRGPRLFDHLEPRINSRSIIIENVAPQLDCGAYPVKREVGDTLEVTANIFRDGHDRLSAVILYRRKSDSGWREVPMAEVNAGLAEWTGSIVLYDNASYVYTIEAWTDLFASWCNEVQKKLGAGQNVTLELIEGRELVEEALRRAKGEDASRLASMIKAFDADDANRATLLLGQDVKAIMSRWPNRETAVRYERELEVFVDRVRARYAAWYEMFPRSQGQDASQSSTFRDCEARLPDIKRMGFDVLYFPPIHPIGRAFRKGRNNTLDAGPEDPGSPYAIGSEEGGHTAIHPELGSVDDFRHLVQACHQHGMEIALDFAIQCAPDHPWIKDHPEWFLFRPDGTIKYAENPPKKYQDIVNVDFFNEHWESLWNELLSVVQYWVDQGVKIFRVDNPHTKPVPFWEWLIRKIHASHPDVIFLAEAFTRPPMLKMLAKVGYSQSYTYFTWRHTKSEFTEYLTELTQTSCKEYLRPNFFTNTPDINPPFLQTGGRPAHQTRVVLAATLSSVYGIYSGFELCEATPVPGTEEYLNSEKYEIRVWDWDRPGNIKDYITRLNQIRRDNPALHELDNLRFYNATNDNVLFYGKMTPDRSNMVFVAVNLDPFTPNETFIDFPLGEMGLGARDPFIAEEMFSFRRLEWQGSRHWLRLDPYGNPCEIFRITRLHDITWR